MLRRVFLAVTLGLLTTLVIAWGVPGAMIASWDMRWNFFGWNPAITGPERYWADDGPPYPRAGFYRVKSDSLLEFVCVVRVDFWDIMEKRDRSVSVAPPDWAATVSVDGREGYAVVTTLASGWPFRCFRGECWMNWRLPFVPPGKSLPPMIFTSGTHHIRALVPIRFSATFLGFPYQPLWPGLLLNIATFAFAWLLILPVVSHLHRYLRLRRHHCPACNYNLAGLPPGTPCPECGLALPPRT